MIDVAHNVGADEPASWARHLELTRRSMLAEGYSLRDTDIELALLLAELRRGRLSARYPEYQTIDALFDDVVALAREARAYANAEALELAADILERVPALPEAVAA